MEEKIIFSQVPYKYPICMNRKCTKAETCLRQLVEQIIPSDIQHWAIISPKFLATLEGACPHYRPIAKVRLAKGFIRMMDNLPRKQMQAATSLLISTFGRRTYYRVRKGERLLSPAEQKKLLDILKNCGISLPQEFDNYIECYDW